MFASRAKGLYTPKNDQAPNQIPHADNAKSPIAVTSKRYPYLTETVYKLEVQPRYLLLGHAEKDSPGI